MQRLTQLSNKECIKGSSAKACTLYIVNYDEDSHTCSSASCSSLFVHPDVIPGALVSRLPESITGFTPSIASTSLREIPVNDIHSSTGEWVSM